MELYEVLRTTGAARTFTDEDVPDEVLFKILDGARHAPSGGNRQPWRVIVIKDEALRLAIRDNYVIGWREYMAHVMAGLVPFAPDELGRWDGPAVDLANARATPSPNDFADHLNEVPVMLVLLAHLPSLAVTDNGVGRQSIVGGASVYPFSQDLLLAAARAEGLGGVMTTVLCREEQTVKHLLGVPDEYAIAGLVVLGHPTHQVTKLRRRAVEDFATVDVWDGARFTAPG